MPKASQSKAIASNKNKFFVYVYNGKRVLGKRQSCYDSAVLSCRSLFPNMPPNCSITFYTKDLDVCENELTIIPEESWEFAISELNMVVVETEEVEWQAPSSTDVLDVKPNLGSRKTLTLIVVSDGCEMRVRVSSTAPLSHLFAFVSGRSGKDVGHYKFLYDSNAILGDYTPEDLEMQDGDQIQCFIDQVGGKPVIYLFSPIALEASVKLALVPQWNLSAIYPVVPIKPRTQTSYEEVSWKVKVHPNGELTETTTGADVAYLFWEAHTDSNVSHYPTPLPSALIESPPCENVVPFCPNSADLNDTNSVVLCIDNITPYLDKALAALSLHTEARTSFITYWLPSLLKHKHIALRFIPQASYEQAAPLAVHPAPDVVTRIFMIFKGISDEELGDWSSATSRAQDDVLSWWKDVVGVDSARAQDASLFRVLEWGGMEVQRR